MRSTTARLRARIADEYTTTTVARPHSICAANRAYRSVGTRANAFDDTSAYAEKSRLGPGACVHDYPATTPTKPSAADSARTGAVRRTVDADTRVPRRPCDLIYRGASTRDSFCTAGNRPSDRRGPGLFGHEGRNLRSTCRCSHNLRITRRRAVSCGLHRPTSQVIHRSGLSTFYFSIKKYIPRYTKRRETTLVALPPRSASPSARALASARDTRVCRRVRRKVIAEKRRALTRPRSTGLPLGYEEPLSSRVCYTHARTRVRTRCGLLRRR